MVQGSVEVCYRMSVRAFRREFDRRGRVELSSVVYHAVESVRAITCERRMRRIRRCLYPSTRSLANQMANAIAITIATFVTRSCLARLRFDPVAIHCAHR
jgi:hypothetical protein